MFFKLKILLRGRERIAFFIDRFPRRFFFKVFFKNVFKIKFLQTSSNTKRKGFQNNYHALSNKLSTKFQNYQKVCIIFKTLPNFSKPPPKEMFAKRFQKVSNTKTDQTYFKETSKHVQTVFKTLPTVLKPETFSAQFQNMFTSLSRSFSCQTLLITIQNVPEVCLGPSKHFHNDFRHVSKCFWKYRKEFQKYSKTCSKQAIKSCST